MISKIRRISTGVSLLVVCLILLVGISVEARQVLAKPTPILSAPTTATAQTPDLGRPFKEFGLEGSILIYDSHQNRTYEYNPQRNARPMVPASTFKIFNAMVALETGVIPNEVAVLTWDGVQREIAAWNHDTNLRQAFKDSTVWFYQVLARRAGHDQMQQWIDKVGYGNRQIGAANKIDRFWLQGPLEITPNNKSSFCSGCTRAIYRSQLERWIW